ncbi:MAG: signal peptidase II [Spirochaetes bacterium RIFOXYC1_FULL_54_7]|nr:MAG: signal peptidase II [Spirochaetes bacterium RIFOXYC1_FULL_54_7]
MGVNSKARALAPLLLSMAIIIVDQLAKLAVARLIPTGRIAWTAFDDFFWLVHQKNTGAAFSIGDSMPEFARVAILILMPLALLVGLCIYMLGTDELSGLQRWAVGGIIGGGIGNIIDRIFRPEGVIDFLSFKFYGLFGLERWPTFNVADSAVVVFGILLVVAGFFIPVVHPESQGNDQGQGQKISREQGQVDGKPSP